MTPLVWALPAQRDIDRIAAQLVEIDAVLARDTFVAIRASSWRLRHYPLSGPIIGGSGLRKLNIKGAPYLLVYRLAGRTVEILRVRHSHEDWLPQ